MHQSQFNPFIQFSYLCLIKSGCQLIFLPISMNFSLRSRYLMNHCFVTKNSTSVPHLSWTFTVCFIGVFLISRFFSSKSLIIDFLASFTAIPAYFPVFLSSLPSLVKELFNGSLWLYHHSISTISPKVQHIKIPVPLFWSTFASSNIGTS